MIDRKLLAIAFIIIAILASMEVRPRTLVLSFAMTEASPSPLNDGPLGTSIMAETLEEAGFRVVVLAEARDLVELALSERRLAVIIIGSEYFTERASKGMIEALTILSEMMDRGGLERLSFLLADELPTEDFRRVMFKAQEALCAESILDIGGFMEVESTIAEFYLAGSTYRVATGLTAPVYSLIQGGVAVAPLPPGSETLIESPEGVEASMVAYAWPSTRPLKGLWYPLAGLCSSPRGAVLVVGDTSLFLNAAIESGATTRDLLVDMARTLLGGGEGTVVFIQEHYVSEDLYNSIVVRILPSILLITLVDSYRSVEGRVLDAIASNGPLAAAFTASLAFITWSLMPYLRERERVKSPRESLIKSRVRVWLLQARRLLRRAP